MSVFAFSRHWSFPAERAEAGGNSCCETRGKQNRAHKHPPRPTQTRGEQKRTQSQYCSNLDGKEKQREISREMRRRQRVSKRKLGFSHGAVTACLRSGMPVSFSFFFFLLHLKLRERLSANNCLKSVRNEKKIDPCLKPSSVSQVAPFRRLLR